jgi:cobalamin biosynthesis Mg chelatase CobN
MSLLALLAMACFPVLVRAEGSAGAQYEPAPLSATPPGSKTQSHSAPKANSSGSNGGGAEAPSGSNRSGSSEESPATDSESSAPPGGAGTGGGGNGGHGQSNPGKNSSHAGGSSAQHLEQASTQQDNGGGSSPLLPILIAVAVLAAISIGAYVYRQRRQSRGPDTRVSPEAG